ncbi:hypothetical protein J2129_001514 [Methanofollis sp. W23]|uniref:hypothetical protein n=1 Tax=Methanofollis sp. W23 TaxID=2817849 RepID=UPI001AEA3F05|nr:hypothetical protein [Methanofollis sp. W23]MBP2146060.1 hypothetical protein [Methanofollis sp. W23]
MRPAPLLFMVLLAIVLTTPVSAAAIDLVIDEETAVSWNETGLAPGDEGEGVVMLRNAGNRPGTLSLWVSALTETDAGGDGAALGRYLLFNLSGEGLESRVTFPAPLAAFPHGPDDPNSIQVSGLGPGESVALTWHWEFLEAHTPQNDAQGDTLTFEVTYHLVEVPPTTPSPSGPGDGGKKVRYWFPSATGMDGVEPENRTVVADGSVVPPTPAGPLPPADWSLIFHWLPALLGIALLAYTRNKAASEGTLPQGTDTPTFVGMLLVLAGAGLAVVEIGGWSGLTCVGGLCHALAGVLAAGVIAFVLICCCTKKGRAWRSRRSALQRRHVVRTITLLLLVALLTGLLMAFTRWWGVPLG